MDENTISPEIIEKYGRPINTKSELSSALNEEILLNPRSPKAYQTHYQSLGFQCVCTAEMHPMNGDYRVKLVLSAKGERFLYKCISSGTYIFFQVKAKWLVNHYCSPIWVVQGDLFDKNISEILKEHRNYNDINI